MPRVISFQPAGVLACRWRLSALTVRRRQQPGAHQPFNPRSRRMNFLWLAGGSLWKVRNEAPEVRNFVVGERHNSVHAGYDTFGDERATHCMDEADSGD
jgi:hypothetical protein